MRSATEISRPGRWPGVIPLILAYAVLPLWTLAGRLGEVPEFPPNAVWAALAGAGLLLALRRPRPGAPARRGFGFSLLVVALLAAGLVRYLPDWRAAVAPALPYLGEGAPLAYLLFAALWASTCGMPDRADFQRFGALLGSLCIAELVVETFLFRAAPSVRLIGNADLLAGLLLIALCAGLRPGPNQGGPDEPDQGRPWWRALTMLGLIACLSRTGLFGAAWVILCFGRGSVARRALFAALCLIVLAVTFFLPPTASDAVRYTDYWLWMEGVRLFSENPMLLLTGFPVNQPLPLNFPMGMGAIWEAATGVSAIFGAYVEQVPSFWLRLSLAWGAAVSVALLCVAFALLLRRLTRLGAGLITALFAQGMITPLLYDPATGVCVGLAMTLALARPAVSSEAPGPAANPEPTPDPATEWDLR